MNKIAIILIILLSAASHAQQNNIESELSKEQEHLPMQGPFLEQQSGIQQSHSQGNSEGIQDITTAVVSILSPYMHWIYFSYSIAWTIFLVKQYLQQRFCFIYTIVNLIHHINNGVLYMSYCELIEGDKFKGKVFFSIVMALNTWKMHQVLSQKGYECQKSIFAVYILFLAIVALWFNDIFGVTFQLIYNFSFFLQIYSIPDQCQGIILTRLIMSTSLNFAVNMLVISYALKYSQLFMMTQSQRSLFGWQYQLIVYALARLSPIIRRKLITKGIVRFYNVGVLKRLGFKLQTDTCVICLQEMEIFGGIFRLEDCGKLQNRSLVRVHRNHIFHNICLSDWISSKKTCPYDNEAI